MEDRFSNIFSQLSNHYYLDQLITYLTFIKQTWLLISKHVKFQSTTIMSQITVKKCWTANKVPRDPNKDQMLYWSDQRRIHMQSTRTI